MLSVVQSDVQYKVAFIIESVIFCYAVEIVSVMYVSSGDQNSCLALNNKNCLAFSLLMTYCLDRVTKNINIRHYSNLRYYNGTRTGCEGSLSSVRTPKIILKKG